MGVNDLWLRGSNGINEFGALIEVQTVSTHENMLPLGRCWWPLTSSLISRTLNVRKKPYIQNQLFIKTFFTL